MATISSMQKAYLPVPLPRDGREPLHGNLNITEKCCVPVHTDTAVRRVSVYACIRVCVRARVRAGVCGYIHK